MKARLFAALGVVALLVATVMAEDKKEVKLDGIKCPLSGKAATENSVDYKGGKVYFCCDMPRVIRRQKARHQGQRPARRHRPGEAGQVPDLARSSTPTPQSP
jgi:hypothetical protein